MAKVRGFNGARQTQQVFVGLPRGLKEGLTQQVLRAHVCMYRYRGLPG